VPLLITRPLRKLPAVCALSVALVAAFLLSGCEAPEKVPFTHLKYWQGYSVPGYYYTVQTGDTLGTIADRFGCDLDLLSRINETQPNRTLSAGQRVFVPRVRGDFPHFYYTKPRVSDPGPAAQTAQANANSSLDPVLAALLASGRPPQGPTVVMVPTPRPVAVASAPTVFKVPPSGTRAMGAAEAIAQPPPDRSALAPVQPTLTAAAAHEKGLEIARAYAKKRDPYASQATVPGAPPFQWPVGGTISSRFNIRSAGARLHNGLDLANPRGTPVHAAYSGRVLYSDNKYLPSMGNMILIEHPGGWVTLYAHNERNLVKEGDYVQTAQIIASVGATGNATGPHLHFEVRKDADTPVDPLLYLPRTR